MAKRLSPRTNNEEPNPAPAVFDEHRFYTDTELADVWRVHPKTVKRQRAKGTGFTRYVELSDHTIRTPGHEANREWQSRLKTSLNDIRPNDE